MPPSENDNAAPPLPLSAAPPSSTPPRRVPKKERPICGATTRAGRPCSARVVARADGSLARRCRVHGGLSTGPRTLEGRERIASAQRARWARWRAQRALEHDQAHAGDSGPSSAPLAA